MEEQTTNESIRRLEARMDERFDHVGAEFGRIDRRFQVVEADIRELRADQKSTAKELGAEIRSMQRTMLYGFFTLGGLILTLAGLMLTYAGLQLT